MKVIHKKTQEVLGENIFHAKTIWSRMKGLMFVNEMRGMDGVMLDPCNSIHNCFVRFPIDVVFISQQNKIVKIIREFKPWRFSGIYFSSKKVLELPAGKLSSSIEEGDELEVQNV